MRTKLELSTLGHTWILDLDGTILKHNGYKIDGKDSFLDGAREFLENIPKKDMIIFVTSREESCRERTESFLEENGIVYHSIIYGAPYGERILMNDDKPSGLKTAISINVKRDANVTIKIEENSKL